MASADSIEKYRQLVDGLVQRREGVLTQRIRQKGWPQLPQNEQLNAFLSKLTSEEKEVVVRIARDARDSGFHDTLVFLQEEMDRNELRIVSKGVTLPVSPFGSEIFWDWLARVRNTAWPNPVPEEPTEQEQ